MISRGTADDSIAVLGRGVMGQFMARALLANGWKVSLFGFSQGAECASSAAVGVQCTKGLLLAHDDLFAVKLRGHKMLARMLFETRECAGVTKLARVLEPFESLEQYRVRRKRIYRRQFTQLLAKDILPADQLQELRGTSERYIGAFCYPDDFWFHPPELLNSLEAGNLATGRATCRETLAKAVSPDGVVFFEDGRREKFAAVVLACGFRGFELAAHCGIPVRGEEWKLAPGWTVDFSGESGFPPVALKIDKSSFVRTSARIVAGSYAAERGVFRIDESGACQSELAQATRQAENVAVPFAGQRATASVRSGVRLKWIRNRPCIAGLGRVVFIGGLYKSGFSLAPPLAEDLVNTMSQQRDFHKLSTGSFAMGIFGSSTSA